MKAPGASQGRLRLAIIGGGSEAGRLQERAEALGVASLVWLPGPRSDAPDLLRSFDIFVLPSLNEGISNTVLEAMASARPVVAAAVGGNGELIEQGVSGVLYEPGDVRTLETAIAQYIDNKVLRAAHGGAGRERCLRRFAIGSMVEGYTRLYDDLLMAH